MGTGTLRRKLLVEWNGRAAPLPPGRTILDLFEDHVAAGPDRPALLWGDRTITYGELDLLAGRLAGTLATRGVGRGDLVPLVTGGGPELPLGMVALMKRAAPFVPVDAAWPVERVQRILSSLDPVVVVCTPATAGLAGPRPVVVDVDALARTATAAPAPTPPAPEELIYGFYTSGSTGTPKCALNVHHGLLNRFVYMARRFGDDGSEVVLQNSRHVFDSSIWQLLWPLTTGSRVVIPQREGILDLAETIETIARYRVTMTDFVPSIFNTLVELVDSDRELIAKLASLRHLLIGGEEISPQAVHRFRALLPGVGITNTYGPTEASIGSVFHEVTDDDGDDIPLGRPIDNTYAVVLDERDELVPPGTVGQIHIGGDCLGRGYLNDPERTSAAFVANPFDEIPGDRLYRTGDLGFVGDDGCLRFVGRVDHQVKVGGVRIELAEVETALRAHDAVQDGRVVAVGPAGAKRLVAFVVARRPVDPADVRAAVAQRLPAASVPARVVVLKQIPLTPNGKADRRALERLALAGGEDAVADAEPLSVTEAAIKRIWLEVLGGGDVGADDNFFARGGDSLGAQQLALALERHFDVPVDLRAVLEAPTVRTQAELVTTGRSPAAAADDLSADTRLDPAIVPTAPPPAGAPRHVLLTGATGFIGAHLLHELLATTDVAVTCVVRAESPAAATAQVRRALARYRLDLTDPGATERLRVLPGDLSRPLLGWDERRFDEVAQAVDAIVHSAAAVNLLLAYPSLRPANVGGTAEILRLAARGGATPVHHLSTLSVLPDGHVPAAEAPAPAAPLPSDGYSQSKWVAERLVASARERGIPTLTYRLGEVAPHARHGIANPRWTLDGIVEACARTGLRFDSPVSLDWTPVDVISRVVVAAVAAGRTEPEIVHVLEPEPVTLDAVLDHVDALSHLRPVAYGEFWTAVAARAEAARDDDSDGDEDRLARLLTLLPRPGTDDGGTPASLADLFRDETRRCSTQRAGALRAALGIGRGADRQAALAVYAAEVCARVGDRTGAPVTAS